MKKVKTPEDTFEVELTREEIEYLCEITNSRVHDRHLNKFILTKLFAKLNEIERI